MKRYLAYFTELSDMHSLPYGQISREFFVHCDSLPIREQVANHISQLRNGDGNKFFILQSICRND